jgi:hypothetical protein
LAGTPTSAGVSVFIVAAAVTDGQTTQCDARNLIVVTEP